MFSVIILHIMDSENFEIYRKTNIYSAGKIKSLLLLIDKGLSESRHAIASLDNNFNNRGAVIKIISQLQMALNLDNGEVAQNLFFLYDYIAESIDENTKESINNAIVIFKRIRSMLEFIEKG